MAETKKIKSKLYQLIVGPICIICGPLVFLLIELVNNGGSAASNLIFILIGSGLIIVGLNYTFGGMARLIKNDYFVVGDNYIELKSWNKVFERVTLTEIDIEDWGYIYLEQSSDNLFLVMLNAIKNQGFTLKLGENIVFVDRFRKGLLNILRNKIKQKNTGDCNPGIPIYTVYEIVLQKN